VNPSSATIAAPNHDGHEETAIDERCHSPLWLHSSHCGHPISTARRARMTSVYENLMGVLGILISLVWLWLVWMSVRSGVTWGWAGGPTRRQRPALFWLVMLAYLALALGFAWRGLVRV
jgi:FtsH-binding integral membrane protein